MVHWKDDEIRILRANLDKTNRELYDLFPDKPKPTLRTMALRFRNGYKYKASSRYWSDLEKDLLRKVYPWVPAVRLLYLFPNRKYGQIVAMARRIL